MNERQNSGGLPRRSALRWNDETGKSSIRGLIALVLIVGMVYLSYKFIPVRTAAYQFNDAIKDEVVSVSGRRRTPDDQIMQNLLDRAVMLNLPITRDKISIVRSANKYIVIEARYTVTVELAGGYNYDWDFSHRHEGPIF